MYTNIIHPFIGLPRFAQRKRYPRNYLFTRCAIDSFISIIEKCGLFKRSSQPRSASMEPSSPDDEGHSFWNLCCCSSSLEQTTSGTQTLKPMFHTIVQAQTENIFICWWLQNWTVNWTDYVMRHRSAVGVDCALEILFESLYCIVFYWVSPICFIHEWRGRPWGGQPLELEENKS